MGIATSSATNVAISASRSRNQERIAPLHAVRSADRSGMARILRTSLGDAKLHIGIPGSAVSKNRDQSVHSPLMRPRRPSSRAPQRRHKAFEVCHSKSLGPNQFPTLDDRNRNSRHAVCRHKIRNRFFDRNALLGRKLAVLRAQRYCHHRRPQDEDDAGRRKPLSFLRTRRTPAKSVNTFCRFTF